MERWSGRVALVTGASSGIGAAIAAALVKQGMKVVGIARNINKIENQSKDLIGEKGSLYALKCDLTKDQEVEDVFRTIEEKYGGVDLCVNNAGMSFNSSLLDGTTEEWRSAMDLNVVSVCLCTKLAIASMRKRGVDDGHIININSISGQRTAPLDIFHFYSGTKFALKAITEGLRQELRALNSHIRASSISPGIVETEFFTRVTSDESKAREMYSSFKCLTPSDIANAVIYVASAPLHVEINELIMRPTEQAR